MNALRRLTSFLLVILAGYCIVAWGVWYSDGMRELFELPFGAHRFPLGPERGPFVAAGLSFLAAYLVHPRGEDD